MSRRRLERLQTVGALAWMGRALSVGGLLCPSAAVWSAEQAGTQRFLAIEPSVSITQTFSDNPELRALDIQGDSITRLTLGLGLRLNQGQVRGLLNYGLSALIQARGSSGNSLQNQLNAAVAADWLDKRAHVDASATIVRSAISAFGAQPDGSANIGRNSTEQRNLRVAPSLQGPVGAGLRYTASLAIQATDVKDNAVGDSTSANLSLHLEPARSTRLAWAADYSHTTNDFKTGRTTEDDRANLSLSLNWDEFDLRLNANAGAEITNLASADRRRYSSWGVGAEWKPSQRTRVVVDYGERFFGKNYAVSAEHRTPLTIWRFTDSRSLSLGNGGGAGSGVRSTAYDLFFAQFASAEPDPTKRADLVSAFLKLNGIDPQSSLNLDFLRSTATVQDRQDLSVAWRNARSSATLMFTRSSTRRLNDGSIVLGDLADTDTVNLRGVSVSVSHRLTPQSALDLTMSQQQGGGQLASQASWQRQYILQYMLSPTAKSNLIVGARHGQYERPAISYAENAVYATYGIRF